MTEMKLDYRLNGAAADALAPHIDRIFETPGASFMAVVEFKRKKIEVEDDEERDSVVRCRAVTIEVGRGEQEHVLRAVQRALYLQRTADGTLDEAESGELEVADKTIQDAQGLISGHEVARLKAGLDAFIEAASAMAGNDALRPADVRRELGKIVTAARKISAGAEAVL